LSSASGERHYSDETLVAYLDRELAADERGAVEQHLGECWSCRVRAAEMEQDIHFVTRLVESESAAGGDEVKRALQKFLARRAEFESSRAPRPVSRRVLPRMPWVPLPWAAAGAALALALAVALWWRGPGDPQPRAIALQAAAMEQKVLRLQQPSHQVIRLEMLAPARTPRDLGTLEIWSDTEAGARYSARWTDPRDNLKHAVWKPAATAGLSYDPDARRAVPCSRPAGTVHLADGVLDAIDPDSMERAFLKWVRGRAWTLVSFTEEWAAFADRAGVEMVVERLREGGPWRLSATRADRGRTFEMILQVDAQSYLPRAEAIRVSADGRVVELRLTVQRWQSLAPLELRPAVFAPPASISILEPLAPLVPRRAPLALLPERVGLPEWALTDLELRVRWALHEALQCVDVALERDGNKGIVVRSRLADEARRAELARTLGGIEGGDYVRVAPVGGGTAGPASHAGMIRKHARVLAELVASARHLRGMPVPQERQLARLFADHRRALRLEMAHLRARLGGSRSAAVTEVTDSAVSPGFLESDEAVALVAALGEQAGELADSPAAARALAPLDKALASLEVCMRRDRAAGVAHAEAQTTVRR